jgi:hypothetical protein
MRKNNMDLEVCIMTDTTIRLKADKNDPKIDFAKIFSIVSEFNLKNTIIEVSEDDESFTLKFYVNNQGPVNWIDANHRSFNLVNVPNYYYIASFDKATLDNGVNEVTLFTNKTNDKYEVDRKSIERAIKKITEAILETL